VQKSRAKNNKGGPFWRIACEILGEELGRGKFLELMAVASNGVQPVFNGFSAFV
jgi:hypothetical protein